MKNLVLLVAAALCSHAAIALTPAQTDALRADFEAAMTWAKGASADDLFALAEQVAQG